MNTKWIYGLILWAGIVQISAQESPWENPNFVSKTIENHPDMVIDSLVILPNTLQIQTLKGEKLSPENYSWNPTTNQLILSPNIQADSLVLQYFIHPDLKPLQRFAKDPNLIIDLPQINTSEAEQYATAVTSSAPKELFQGIQSNGSIVRGITFGNNQGGSAQSSLDLQLTGKLSEDVFINAAISDNNVPIEADGYTQNLEQFDQVYVELYNQNSKIRAGHVDLEQTQDFFGNFAQKVTGLQVSHQIEHADATTLVHVAGSVSRGEFAQNRFTGQDGNQGPYRLTGNNNEAFVIILSGSERVFIDGVLLTRGQNQDYVINYNTGEITFTSNRIIQANHRIIVEYLYTNRSYNRFTLYGGAEHQGSKWSWGTHVYSESDNKNNPINQNLSEEEQMVLANAGNNTDDMFAVSATPAPFDSNKIQYRQIQVQGETVYEYYTQDDVQVYDVTFSRVGQNQGNYVLSTDGVNGRVFEYISPVNGVPQGEYEPLRRLIAPERHQLATLNAAYRWKENGFFAIDAGLSNKDLNLFSSIEDENNQGIALRIRTQNEWVKNQFTLQPGVEYSFIQQQYAPLQRLRKPEFARQFNIPNEVSSANQHFLQFYLNSQYKNHTRLRYDAFYLNQDQNYQGLKHQISAEHNTTKTQLQTTASLLNTSQQEEESTFLQYNTSAAYTPAKWRLGVGLHGEDNQRKLANDSLSINSFRWQEWYTQIAKGDSSSTFAQLRLYHRTDDSARLGNLARINTSYGASFQTRVIYNAHHRLSSNIHYRNVRYPYENRAQENFVTGNLSWFKSLWNQGLQFNAFYELGSGTEPQREFSYVKVTDGQGIYKWTDYNEDGIEQLDEFEVAEFSDQANYIRVFNNTTNFLQINQNNFTLSFHLKPERWWKGKQKFVKRFQLQASLATQGSFLKNGKTAQWLPFGTGDDLRAKTQNIRALVNYNLSNQYKWSVSYEFSDLVNQNLVFTGLESRKQFFHKANVRYRPQEFLFADLLQEWGNIESDSENFEARRYNLSYWQLAPRITYQIPNHLTSSLQYTWQQKDNLQGDEFLTAQKLLGEIQWNPSAKMSLAGNLSFVNNQFAGDSFTVVANQMMEGLRQGNNWVWSVLLQRQLNDFLEINVSYNGRKSELNNAIHTGSIQLRARF